MPDKSCIQYTGLLVISIAACLFVLFLQQIMLTLPRAVANLSRVIRLPSRWHFYMKRMQRAYADVLESPHRGDSGIYPTYDLMENLLIT